MRLAVAKPVECLALTHPHLVPTGKMAHILGVNRRHLGCMARAGKIPSTVVGTDRRYNPEEVIEVAIGHDLPLPPLRKPNIDRVKAMTWAFEAYSQGIWNVPTAPCGQAWRHWLWAIQTRTGRNHLLRFATKLAEREIVLRWTKDDDAEQPEAGRFNPADEFLGRRAKMGLAT